MAVLTSQRFWEDDGEMEPDLVRGFKNACAFLKRCSVPGVPPCDWDLVKQDARLRLVRGAGKDRWIRDQLASSEVRCHGKAALKCLDWACFDYWREWKKSLSWEDAAEAVPIESDQERRDREATEYKCEEIRKGFATLAPLSQHVLHTAPEDRATVLLKLCEAKEYDRSTRVLHDRDRKSGIPDQVQKWASPDSDLPLATRNDQAFEQFKQAIQNASEDN